MQIDFEKEFSEFVNTGGSNSVFDIYKILPTLSDEQQAVVLGLDMFIAKYNLSPLKSFLDLYLTNKKANKNLGFLNSMQAKNLLKAYTLEEQVKGIKVNNSTMREG